MMCSGLSDAQTILTVSERAPELVYILARKAHLRWSNLVAQWIDRSCNIVGFHIVTAALSHTEGGDRLGESPVKLCQRAVQADY